LKGQTLKGGGLAFCSALATPCSVKLTRGSQGLSSLLAAHQRPCGASPSCPDPAAPLPPRERRRKSPTTPALIQPLVGPTTSSSPQTWLETMQLQVLPHSREGWGAPAGGLTFPAATTCLSALAQMWLGLTELSLHAFKPHIPSCSRPNMAPFGSEVPCGPPFASPPDLEAQTSSTRPLLAPTLVGSSS